MRTFNQWMAEYGESHQDPTNQIIHKICVPLIMLSVIGLLYSIPTFDFFNQVPFLNWGTIFVLICLVFYLSLNLMMFFGMLFLALAMVAACHYMASAGVLLPVSLAIFVLSWIAQFYGHKIEGKKPSFAKDLVFLLIGPLWVLRFFYTKLGLKV